MNKLNIQDAINCIKSGGVGVFPTDTVFGIGCRMDNEESVKRVFDIKKRAYDNALLVLVDSVQMATSYVKIPQDVRKKLVDVYWPGGLTIFFTCRENKVPAVVNAGTSILAIRWPKQTMIERIIQSVGVPIIATSANISGEDTPYSLSEVSKNIIAQVDFVLDGECTYKKESTIIDTTVKPWNIVRSGAVNIEI